MCDNVPGFVVKFYEKLIIDKKKPGGKQSNFSYVFILHPSLII